MCVLLVLKEKIVPTGLLLQSLPNLLEKVLPFVPVSVRKCVLIIPQPVTLINAIQCAMIVVLPKLKPTFLPKMLPVNVWKVLKRVFWKKNCKNMKKGGAAEEECCD